MVGRRKKLLVQVDDLALMAKIKEKIKSMDRFKKYVEKKMLILDVSKPKVLMFKNWAKNKKYNCNKNKKVIEVLKRMWGIAERKWQGWCYLMQSLEHCYYMDKRYGGGREKLQLRYLKWTLGLKQISFTLMSKSFSKKSNKVWAEE